MPTACGVELRYMDGTTPSPRTMTFVRTRRSPLAGGILGEVASQAR